MLIVLVKISEVVMLNLYSTLKFTDFWQLVQSIVSLKKLWKRSYVSKQEKYMFIWVKPQPS